jgi:hypothetical protein
VNDKKHTRNNVKTIPGKGSITPLPGTLKLAHMKKKKLLILLTVLLMGITMNICLAQTGTDPDDPSLNDPADIPVDGGVSLLLAAGLAYGVKQNRKKRSEDRV